MKIYAHRGASIDFPEMTMRAYQGALDDGADGFECDVRVTQDNQLVLWHDADMKRVASYSGRIAEMDFMEIKRHYPEAILLDELLELARDNKKELAIETKHPVPTGSAVEKKVMQLITQEVQLHEITIMSFSWLALENIRKINPLQPTVALLKDSFNTLMRRYTSAHYLGPSVEYLRLKPELTHEHRKLFVWTVDDADDMRFCSDNGVEVLITNNPSYARRVLGYH
ncbi:MAG: glycerophosphodiester phosphodiesterase family protein [Candidatus Planktophila sp.]|nr:glycerophosphodiester phosphodiesterase family protein [Candidatus Planktophila sp.]